MLGKIKSNVKMKSFCIAAKLCAVATVIDVSITSYISELRHECFIRPVSFSAVGVSSYSIGAEGRDTELEGVKMSFGAYLCSNMLIFGASSIIICAH